MEAVVYTFWPSANGFPGKNPPWPLSCPQVLCFDHRDGARLGAKVMDRPIKTRLRSFTFTLDIDLSQTCRHHYQDYHERSA